MKQIVNRLPHLLRIAIQSIGLSLVILITSAAAQTAQPKQKAAVQNNKQAGFKVKQNTLNQSSKSMSLNPELFKRIEGEYSNDGGSNLDYRVQRGCLRRSYNEDKSH